MAAIVLRGSTISWPERLLTPVSDLPILKTMITFC